MTASREPVPRKRPAYEPAARLARPVPHDPGMPRPASTTAGALLVLLRAVAGLLWMVAFWFGWGEWLQGLAGAFSGDASQAALPATVSQAIVAVVLVMVGIGVLVEAVLAVLILRGRNGPRVLVMVLSVGSISSAFASWWAQGQEIRLQTTFLTLSLDILILLALSSRSSAAYARRFERR